MRKISKKLQLKLQSLPDSPGVYLFRDNRGKVIYIGKAKQLKNRVRTYFGPIEKMEPKTSRMVTKISDLDLMVTDSEVEALILEANLIHEQKPRYNVMLKDDKHFPYIKITTNEHFPRVLIVRKIEKDGATYFGPYTSAKGMRSTVNFLCQTFMIRTCSFIIPHPKGREYKVCLDYRIGRCGGPCANLQAEDDYDRQVQSVLMILSGKTKKLTEKLDRKMQQASKAMDFEAAKTYRDQITAIESMMIKQRVDVGEIVDRDIVAVAREDKDGIAVVMQLREGVLIGRQHFQLTAEPEETEEEVIRSFLSQYYNHQPNLPSEIYLPKQFPDIKLLQKWLRSESKKRVKIITPQIGEKLKLVDLAGKNARLLLDEILIQKMKFSERTSKMVSSLKDDLGLARSPRRLVCFDISNTGETDAVGSCVFFENGAPKKSEYRHFRIKGVKGQDDYKMMREVIGRYFFRIKETNEKGQDQNGKKQVQPDLVIVDGGKGQLSSAVMELKHLGFDSQPIIGLAKRLEEVYKPGSIDPIILSKSSPGLILLKRARDESHRFAITFNRKVRSKRTIKSALDDIAGIGPAKRTALLKKFKSVAQIKKKSVEELMQVKGITTALAEQILKSLDK